MRGYLQGRLLLDLLVPRAVDILRSQLRPHVCVEPPSHELVAKPTCGPKQGSEAGAGARGASRMWGSRRSERVTAASVASPCFTALSSEFVQIVLPISRSCDQNVLSMNGRTLCLT